MGVNKVVRKVSGRGSVATITRSLHRMVRQLESHHQYAVEEAEKKAAKAAEMLSAAEAERVEAQKAITAAKKIAALFDDDTAPEEKKD